MKTIKALLLIMLAICLLFPSPIDRARSEEATPPTFADGEPFDRQVYTADGEEETLFGSPTFAIYSIEGCGKCMGIVERMDIILELLQDAPFKIRFLWQDVIPDDFLSEDYAHKDAHLTLKDPSPGFNFTPSFYFLDAEGTVLSSYVTIEEAMAALYETDFIPKDTIYEASLRYFSEHIIQDASKPQILYFAMTGCPDCAEADAMMLENAELFDQFETNIIYRHNETDPTKVRDEFSIFRHALGIQWYPSFLVIIGDSVTLIGQEPIENLPHLFAALLKVAE